MKRSEFIREILRVVDSQLLPTGINWIYCDRSQSGNPSKKNTYFLRLKYPCYSSKVKINFLEYKQKIREYMKSIGETEATVHLRTTHHPVYKNYYFIEIIFHNGKPWKKNLQKPMNQESFTLAGGKKLHSNYSFEKPKSIDKWTVSKEELVRLIKLDISANPNKYTSQLSDDELIKLFEKVTK